MYNVFIVMNILLIIRNYKIENKSLLCRKFEWLIIQPFLFSWLFKERVSPEIHSVILFKEVYFEFEKWWEAFLEIPQFVLSKHSFNSFRPLIYVSLLEVTFKNDCFITSTARPFLLVKDHEMNVSII